MIPDPTKLDLFSELRVPQNFSTDGIQSRVLDDHFGVLARGLVVLEIDNTWWETSLEFGCVFRGDGRKDLDMREETVGSGGWKNDSEVSYAVEHDDIHRILTNWRKLGVVLADSLDSVQQHVQLLPRPHLD